MADERTILITGAGSGIGAATARLASAAGWRVVLGGRREEPLEELARELGRHALAQRCDVTRFEDQEALVASAIDRFGGLDATFANAGFGARRGFLEESVEHWRSMVETNVLGAAFTIRAALPHFRERGAGHFLLTGSVAGRRALPGSLYSSTKWAVSGMGESLRAELADTDIKVTLIEPGMVDTPFFDNRVNDALHAEDIARTVMFALSQPAHVDINEILVRPIHQPQ
ncbi:MAG: SDR family oxidoreductase [Thermoleophilaceae bacterium]